MTEYVQVERDDIFWLLQGVETAELTVEARNRLRRITQAVNAQPRRDGRPGADPLGFHVFTVHQEDGVPLAVRPEPGAAIMLAQAINMTYPVSLARVSGYRFDQVGHGTDIEVPS